MIVVGLTGSIGMGKSTVAAMLETLGVRVHDADAEVHRLLEPGGGAYQAVSAAFPYIRHPGIYSKANGRRIVNRSALGKIIFKDDRKRTRLEQILHPLVRKSQNDFIRACKIGGQKIAVLEIPLLFEAGSDDMVDVIITVSAPYESQRARVLERPGMTEEKFHAILASQMADRDKQARSDYVVHTGLSKSQTMKELKKVLKDIDDRWQP